MVDRQRRKKIIARRFSTSVHLRSFHVVTPATFAAVSLIGHLSLRTHSLS